MLVYDLKKTDARELNHQAGRELCGDVHVEVAKDQSTLAEMSLADEDYDTVFKDFHTVDHVRVMQGVLCPAHDRVWSETREHKLRILRHVARTLHAIGGVLYILCPPWPPWIIHKVAFRAPSRGEYYYLVGGEKDNRQAVFTATEAKDLKNLQICLPHLLRPRVKAIDIYYHILRCKADIADFLRCDLLVFDYAGYGVSDGEPNEKAVYDSVERVYKYATEDMGYEPKDIVLIGFSLGTAAMVHIASITPDLGAIVLIAPFTSLRRVILRQPNITVTSSMDMFPR
ncbi:unnamed protein product [Nippostrongylus brasiliensis]|uniref:Mername-AA194 putative peptidase (inferred by orthology to a S. mansoni protein) n=1 Tax=Nippostrongylus brasiliensis TaxID=27835 RepID=A0A0N4XU35_NIPBR|nr:unnamed protein product [Nippostrongylus brasiliensis]